MLKTVIEQGRFYFLPLEGEDIDIFLIIHRQSINSNYMRLTRHFEASKQDLLSLRGSEVKASACNVRDLGLIPGSGRSPGEGNGKPLQYSCLENPMDEEASWAIVYGVSKSRTRLSDFTFLPFLSLKENSPPFSVAYNT